MINKQQQKLIDKNVTITKLLINITPLGFEEKHIKFTLKTNKPKFTY